MSIPDNDYQILKLTDVFYRSYPNPPYKEILKSNNVPITVFYFRLIMIILLQFPIEVIYIIIMALNSQVQPALKIILPD